MEHLLVIDLEHARDFLRRHRHGVLATIRRDGRPQLSNILYVLDGDGRLKISVTQTRAKTKNLRRDPRATLHVQGRDAYEYLVVDGTVELIEGDGLAEKLRDYYRKASGEHPDWAEYDAAGASPLASGALVPHERLRRLLRAALVSEPPGRSPS